MHNATFEEIAEYIADARTFAVCGHVNPDGDSIGSVLGMTHALRALGKEVQPLLANTSKVPLRYHFLEGADGFVFGDRFEDTPDVFIQVDTPNNDRVGFAHEVLVRCPKSVSIDHHPYEGVGAKLELCDPTAASASMLVWEMAKTLLGQPPVEVAEACYTGLISDTGRFQFQNTDARALACAGELVAAGVDPAHIATEVYQNRRPAAVRLEARMVERMSFTEHGLVAYSWIDEPDFDELGAKREDMEGLIDTLRSIEGIEVALLMQGRKKDVRCSIRAKHDVDVSKVAERFGGGGHKAASGFTLEGTLAERREELVAMLAEVEATLM